MIGHWFRNNFIVRNAKFIVKEKADDSNNLISFWIGESTPKSS